jgi:hypothetical protein
MTNPTPLRRSIRIYKPTQKALEAALTFSPNLPTRRSARIATQNQKTVFTKLITRSLDIEDVPLSVFIENYISPSPTSSHSSSSSKSSKSSFETSTPSSPSSSEDNFLSNDNIEYTAGHALTSASSSADSRLDGENEYEEDDFLVGDDDDDDEEVGVSSEISIGSSRKGSTSSTSSSSSSQGSELFITESEDDEPKSKSAHEGKFKLVDPDVEPSDVAEEITDAVMRFSRRCNRLNEPLRLKIT